VADEEVHAARRAGPVAVVEVEAFALDDEGADAILGNRVNGGGQRVAGRVPGFATEPSRLE
jgi:hypothetical protein